jgi:hypothetical protein
MDKPWYQSKAVWGAIALFIAGGLEAIGVSGYAEIIRNICTVIGLPLLGIGIRSAMK